MAKNKGDDSLHLKAELTDLLWGKLATMLSAVLEENIETWKGVLHKTGTWRPVDEIAFEKLIGLVRPLRQMDPKSIPESAIDSIAHTIMEVRWL